jgi:hypothetical protein
MGISSSCPQHETKASAKTDRSATMQDVWQKLNLNKQQEIAVLNAPGSFEPQLKKLQTVRVKRRLTAAKEIHFVLAFVMNRAELDRRRTRLVRLSQGQLEELHLRLQPRQRLGCITRVRVRHGEAGRHRRGLVRTAFSPRRVHQRAPARVKRCKLERGRSATYQAMRSWSSSRNVTKANVTT